MVSIALDANLLIAFSKVDHAFHHRAVAVLATPGVRFVAHSLTVAEYLVHPASLGRAGAAREVLVERLRIAILGDGDLADSAQPWEVTLANTRAASGLTMPDAVVLATAQRLGDCDIASFDDRLRAAAEAAGIRVVG
jgi:predicted nucleic acid-binding protein